MSWQVASVTGGGALAERVGKLEPADVGLEPVSDPRIRIGAPCERGARRRRVIGVDEPLPFILLGEGRPRRPPGRGEDAD
jgi:hypothetical protein